MTGDQLRRAFLRAKLGCLPKNASSSFVRGTLAWARQATDAGHDFSALRRDLLERVQASARPAPARFKPGTRLIREWQGVTHEVTIETDGFTWSGKHFTNLSEIARAITGTRWSGPRFFGLKN
jgi:hypothetical protein